MKRFLLVMLAVVLTSAGCTSSTAIPAAETADDSGSRVVLGTATETESVATTAFIEPTSEPTEPDPEPTAIEPTPEPTATEPDPEATAEPTTTAVSVTGDPEIEAPSARDEEYQELLDLLDRAAAAPDWCSGAEAFELQSGIAPRLVQKGATEEIEALLPRIVDNMERAAAFAPSEIAVEVTATAQALAEWERALSQNRWNYEGAGLQPLRQENDLFRGIRIAEYNADICGLDNGYGTAARAHLLDGEPLAPVDPEEHESSAALLVEYSGFTVEEADCIVAAQERVAMSTLLEVYGICGIPFERLMEILAPGS